MNAYYAYCWRSGLIEFGGDLPDGAILIAQGHYLHRDNIKEIVNVRARHGWDGQLLVPGVPEAKSDDEALDALLTWQSWADVGGRTEWSSDALDLAGM